MSLVGGQTADQRQMVQIPMPFGDSWESLSRDREHYADVLATLKEKERRYEILLAQPQQDHQDIDHHREKSC